MPQLFYVEVASFVPVMAEDGEAAKAQVESLILITASTRVWGPIDLPSDLASTRLEVSQVELWESTPLGGTCSIRDYLLPDHPRWTRRFSGLVRDDGVQVNKAPPASIWWDKWSVNFYRKGASPLTMLLYTDGVFASPTRIMDEGGKEWWFFDTALEALEYLDEHWPDVSSPKKD